MKTLLNTLLILLVLNATTFANDTPGLFHFEEKAQTKILTPSYQACSTAKIRLPNGLSAYIISDPEATQSAAALTVLTGSLDDPQGAAGTAHFLEHMLFRSTASGPDELDFDEFIGIHGGITNAFTNDSQTSFLFTINNDAFDKTLSRFADLFIAPLLQESDMKSEIKAIDQEFSKNQENDYVREIYVLKDLVVPTHPLHAFGMGNEKSLHNLSREDLKQWYEHHYSADIMRLIIISPQPLDTLKKLVTENFSDIPDRITQPRESFPPTFPEDLHHQLIYIEPIKHLKSVTLFWDLPIHSDVHPEYILCHLLGHEGHKSLLAYLKSQHLATGLTCGADNTIPGTLQIFLQIDLSETGIKQVQNVITSCFEAISVLRNQPISKSLLEEIRALHLLNYQYQLRGNLYHQIELHAHNIAHEGMETYPEQSHMLHDADAEAFPQLLQSLTPENALYIVLAPASLTGVIPNKTETWLGVQYALQPIPAKNFQEWKNPPLSQHIGLPDLNPYLPSSLSVGPILEHDTLHPEPVPILDDLTGFVYYAPDEHYGLPITTLLLQMKTPAIQPEKNETTVLADLYVQMVQHTLAPLTFTASSAGIEINLIPKENGIAIQLDGYGDQLPRLLDDLCLKLATYQPDEKLFMTHKKELHKAYLNAAKNPPLSQAIESFYDIILPDYITNKTSASLLSKITFPRFQKFVKSLFKEAYCEGMIFGNIEQNQAEELVAKVLATFNSKPYPKEKQWKKIVIDLPDTPYSYESKIKAQGNAALLAIEAPPYDFKLRAAQQILMQAIRQPFFNELRTKQQTGYIAFSQAQDFEKHLFNFFAVQSNTHDGAELIARFELFLEEFYETLFHRTFTEEQFNQFKQAILTELLTPPKNPAEMAVVLNKLAFSYDGDFHWFDKRIDACRELTYEEFLTLSMEMIGKKNRHRLAIIKTGTISNEVLRYKRICSPKLIK